MKFKAKPEKSNMLLMTSIFFLLVVTCIFWFILREYVYCVIYFILTLIIAHMYYFTNYIVKEDYLVIKLGFLKIKFKYNKIKNVEIINDKVKLELKNINFNLYPNNKEIFIAKLNSKLTNKNSYNIINKK